MGSLCSTIDELTYDEIANRPCAYAKYMDKIEFEQYKNMFDEEQVTNERNDTDDFTLDAMRLHFRMQGEKMWDHMDEQERMQMQRKIQVSLILYRRPSLFESLSPLSITRELILTSLFSFIVIV